MSIHNHVKKFFESMGIIVTVIFLLIPTLVIIEKISDKIQNLRTKTLDINIPQYDYFRFHADYFTQEQFNIEELSVTL